MSLVIRPLAVDDLEQLGSWFADAATTRWLGGPDYPRRLLELATAPGRWAFVATEGGELLALADLERDDEEPSSAVVGLVVAPARRGLGIGRRVFAALLARPELASLRELVGEVEAGNVVAERCVLAAGFRPEGTARDSSFTRYVLRVRE